MFVDSHCHLNHERFHGDVEGAIGRAQAAGVGPIVVVGTDLPSSEEAIRLSDQHPGLYATVGVHPHDARLYDAAGEARIREMAAHPRVVAIGEIGLDYHYGFSTPDEQRRAFRAQLQVAGELGMPIVVHCREAYPEALDTLAGSGPLGGVMHCWAGTGEEARRALDLGFYLGFGGVLTFRNADEVRDVAVSAPVDRLLVETDAPYLAPVPHRGHRNEPAWVAHVVERLADLRAMSVAETADATTANAYRLFTTMAG